MPVATSIVWTIAAAAMLLAAAPAQAGRVLIRQVSQLYDDPGVRQTSAMYEALAGANVVYAQCGSKLGITPDHQGYLAAKFDEVARAYVAAYSAAYSARVKGAPSERLLADITKDITAQQQRTVNNTALAIQKRGCTEPRLRHITRYVDELRARDLAAPKTLAPVAAPY